MRICFFALISIAVGFLALLPNTISGEVLYVKDGSTLRGTMVRFVNDTLYFRTTFGAVVPVFRERIVRIEFVSGVQPGPDAAAALDVPPSEARPGTLMVDFEEFQLSSRISVHRDRNRPAHERANSISETLFVNGSLAYTYRDSMTDKVVRKGTETILRNDMKPVSFSIPLDAGTHRCEIAIGNTLAQGFEDRFDGKPLDKSVAVEAVVIRPGETTLLVVGLRKSKLGLGKSHLEVLRHR